MKIKIYTLLFVFAGLFLNVNAAYLKDVPQKLTQPNGEIIHCFASGDEYHNWLHDSLGYTIIRHPQTGYYVYALQSGDGVEASEHIVGVSNPVALQLTPHVNISVERKMERRAAMEIPDINKGKKSDNNHGHINNLVFYIRFSDETKFETNNYTTISNLFNDSSSTSSNSMYNFYKQASYGKFTVTTSFYPTSSSNVIYSYQDTHPRSYFLAKDSVNLTGYADNNERKLREHGLLMRAVNFFADSIPSSLDLDFNNDGYVDNVCFITSGSPEGWNGLMWPHRWSLSTHNISINGKRVWDYNFIMETYTHVGVITHEFMHSLGAPDLYRYYTDTDIHPVGVWDLMGSTNYAKPQGLGAYMKYKYGNWLDPESIQEITTSGTYTLYPANDTSSYKSMCIIRNPHSTEYLVLDYRSTTSSTFESTLPGSGILIYRIRPFQNGNAYYDGIEIFDEVYLYRPNGSKTNIGNLDKAHFSKNVGRTQFDTTTNPYPYFTNEVVMNDIIISNISYAGDSIQFSFEREMFLSVDSNFFELEYYEGAEAIFNIMSNTTWKISNIPAWLQLSETAGIGNATITMTVVDENRGETDTCLFILRTTDQLLEQEIMVRRESYPLFISNDNLFIETNAGDTTSFVITSRIDWNINHNADWISLSQPQGNAGDYRIIVTVDENTTTTSRSDTLILSSASLDTSFMIFVTQSGRNSIIELAETAKILLFPNPTQDVLNIHFEELHSFTDISIYTIIGELIYQSPISNNNMKISTAHLPTGIYIVTFNSPQGAVTKKILVM